MIKELANIIRERAELSMHVYIIGNGGSASNANHFASDLVACNVLAHSLTANVATLTAIANDYGYEYIFSRQLDVYGAVGDLLIALSGSGKSKNILTAIDMAYQHGMIVYTIFGNELDLDMQSAEEYQLTVAHGVRKCLLSQTA